MTTLPESIKKRIKEEAIECGKKFSTEGDYSGYTDMKMSCYAQGCKEGYTAAATAILSKPEEYNLTHNDRVQQLEQALREIQENIKVLLTKPPSHQESAV